MGKGLILKTLIVVGVFVGAFYVFGSKDTSTGGSVTSPSLYQTTKADQKIRIGIQSGHLNVEDVPAELSKLQWNFGSSAGSYNEKDLVLIVSKLIKKKLEAKGYEVDLLEATIPENYKADAFVSIHADGNEYDYVSGYKIAASSFDDTELSQQLADAIKATYSQAVSIKEDTNITADMTEYYCFNYIKYNHSVTSTTPAAIVELGFITNAIDRSLMVKQPDKLATAIATGIDNFAKTKAD